MQKKFEIVTINNCSKKINNPPLEQKNLKTKINIKKKSILNDYFSFRHLESNEKLSIENYYKNEQSKSNNTNDPTTLSNSHYINNYNYLTKLLNYPKSNQKLNIESTIITDNNKSINILKNHQSDNIIYNSNSTEGLLEKNNYNNNFQKEKYLILEIIISWNLPTGLMLKINKYGIENSLRKKKDGIVYFGYQNEKNLLINPEIDYLLLPKEENFDEKFVGKHFKIEYKNNKYFIQDLGCGFGTFIKMNKQIKIQDKFLINIGETYIVFSLDNDEDENNQDETQINIKVFTGNEKCESFNFDFFSHPTILIGRNISCDVYIKDKLLSRVHCYVFYEDSDDLEKKGWYLKDGNLEGKKSTNDTWFYCSEDSEISDGMIFKTNHNLFKCSLKCNE